MKVTSAILFIALTGCTTANHYDVYKYRVDNTIVCDYYDGKKPKGMIVGDDNQVNRDLPCPTWEKP